MATIERSLCTNDCPGTPGASPCTRDRRCRLAGALLAAAVLAALGATPAARAMQATRILGGPGGEPFADRPPPDVQLVAVVIRAGASVDAVAPVLRRGDGTPFTVSLHGGLGGDVNTFRLDKGERLTAMSVWASRSTIEAIQFETSVKRSRIYGTPKSESFRVTVPTGHSAVGFVGRSGAQLNAIGFALQPDWALPRANPITGFGPGGTLRPLPTR
ncbi:jacalin-like lectin [Piscinibacter koreensis]|uniref:Jacalin-type lectin domain-containing protein n=1 Tax=Piscinibacter koreensis TaxID=2742824 RepID=A0A7Y6NKX9_9BURK|nr:jacalin-like lectin [Schlegelella koreensis]NUZ05101.1 hypothetical protein [Schlegelella koreensis]